jgi:broad specificity phosphatase PhoE
MAVDQDIAPLPDQQTAPPQTDPVEKYYNYLKQAGADVAPNVESFKKTLSNDKTAQQYYNYLRANKFDAPPTYGSFARTLRVQQQTYQTQLSNDEEQKYQQWKQKLPGDLKNDNDYDLRGQYKQNPNVEPSERMHFTDEFKKPNHITFSDQSKYNDPNNGVIGGHWEGDDNSGTFYASSQNVKNAGGLDKLQQYFKQYEPGYKVIAPGPDGKPLKSNEPPEHELQHTDLQDVRHLQEMANKPVESQPLTVGAGTVQAPDPAAIATNKAYKNQYDKAATDLSGQWGAKPEIVKQVLTDFPDEQDENKLKAFATLANENPVKYNRLKNANDIRNDLAKDGSNGVNDANLFNHLQNPASYDELTQHTIPIQKEIMAAHGMGSDAIDKLQQSWSPLINSLDPGLLHKQWNGPDKVLGLTGDEYAGLETLRAFKPGVAHMYEGILKGAQGIGEDGKANPVDMSTKPYEYQRGVENVRYALEQMGRDNKAKYLAENKPDIDKQVDALKADYQARINAAKTPGEQQQLIQEFSNHPIVQEANRLEDAAGDLRYSQGEDQRRYPLNFADQATRAVKEATDNAAGFWGDTGKWLGDIVQGAGQQADNTMRFIKNTAINLAGSEEQVAFNNAKNIGHQALTDLSAYEPKSYTGVEPFLNVPRETAQGVQDIFNDQNLSDDQKQQKAISYVRDNFDKLTVNNQAGQQNMTGKAALFQAANVMGQILGIANQSFLMGGAIGDASKLQQMATAFTPMYMSTQNQMYEQALKNGEENPLLKSNIDATIISLASLINPDIKVVRGMVGADTGVGKMLAGIDESTWNKVLSENKPLVDRAIGAAKATGRQIGLANLQYGVIAPTAQYLAHKSLLNEDANLGDMIKDGVIQTSIAMALPSLLHGVWGGLKANEVNPQQKYAIVEAGLKPDQNIDLIDSQIKAGKIPEIQGHEMKQVIKHAGEILQNKDLFLKTDGSPMNENEVSDVVYNQLKLKGLQGKLKTAPEPLKPVIEEQIHSLNKDISDQYTSEKDKQTSDLNQLLHDNLDRIKDKAPEMEQTVKDAIAANTPEEVFKTIADQAKETKKVEGKEVSSRSDVEEIFGKPLVDKAIELSKQKTKSDEKTSQGEQALPRKQVKEPEGAEGTTNSVGAAPSIIPDKNFRTLDYGDNKGKDETPEQKEKIKEQILSNEPIGGNGERFSQLLDRVIPSFKNALDNEPDNTAIVTHSSVIKALQVWEEMGRPDISEIKGDKLKEFAQKYVDLKPEGEGKIHTFKGDNGNDIKVIRHGETEDNVASEFREDNTKLTDKGEAQAAKAGENLVKETGGNIPKIITSDLDRTEHTSDIINQKIKDNATNSRSTESSQSQGGENTSGQVQEQSAVNPESQSTTTGQAPPNGGQGAEQGIDELPFGHLPVGISHDAQIDRSNAELNVSPPERGEGITMQEAVQKGRDLIANGESPEKVLEDFKKDGKVSADAMSVVRAKYEQLAKATNDAYDKFGEGSKEAKAAFEAERKWYDEAVKPMQTEWHKIGMTQQGVSDVDTGSVTGMNRAFNERTGKDFTPEQEKQAKVYADKVKELNNKVKDLQAKLDKAMADQKTDSDTNIKEKAKNLAKKIRDNAKLSRPGMFSSATPASVAWDAAVEIVAKSIEAGGTIAQAIADGIDHIKRTDWYKGLSDKDKTSAERQFTDWHSTQLKETPNLATDFAGKQDEKFTPDEAKKIWQYTKEKYLDKDTPFPDALRNVATDLGLNRKQVVAAIATPKGSREITLEMYKRQYERTKAINSAKTFIETANNSKAKNFFNALPSVFFNLKTYGHGTVGFLTHAGPNIFRPSVWGSYWPNFFKQFSFAFGRDLGKYQEAIEGLKASPHFDEWKRAGLAVDPNEAYDQYQMFGIKQSWLGEAGTRGFNALKFLRYDMAESFYKSASDAERADPNLREHLAELVNHATGHSEVKVPGKVANLFFAPGLEISRWQRMITDPAQAIKTVANWGKATPAEQAAAKVVFRGAGEKLATYGALLAANAGLLSAIGSKQKINYSDPSKSDWLKFKGGDKTLDFTGGVLNPLRLLSVIGREAYLTRYGDKQDLRTKPGDKDASTLASQARYKLSPLAGTGVDILTGTDAMGNVLPWANIQPSKGRHKIDWGEFALQQTPLPIAAGAQAVYDGMRERGVPTPQINDIFNGALQFGVEGFTGVRLSPDYSLEQGGSGGGARAGGRFGTRAPRGSR